MKFDSKQPKSPRESLPTNSVAMSLNSLDDVCLFQLFKYISFRELFNLRILNKRFYFLIREHLQSIRHVEFNYDDDDDDAPTNQQLKIGNRLNVFKFRELNDFNTLIRANFFHFENLITLKLINLELNDRSFQYLIQQPFVGSSLEFIEIYKCNFQLPADRELTYWELFLKKAGRTLQSLILIKNRINTNCLLNRIAFYCRRLKTLSLDLNQFYCLNDSCTPKRTGQFYSFYQLPIEDLKLYGTKKEYFSSDNIGKIVNFDRIQILSLDCVPISNTHLIHVFNHLINVRVLKFVLNSNHRNVDDFYSELAYSIASRDHLEQLHLLESREIVSIDELFQTLVPLMNNKLRVLEIQNSLLNDCTFELICNQLTNLNALLINSFTSCILENFYFSVFLSKRMKRNNLVTNLAKLRSLTYLSLIYTIVTDDELCDLLDEFEGNLTHLVLDGCLELTTKTVRKVCDQAFDNSDKNYCLKLSNDLYKQLDNCPIQRLPSNLTILKNTNISKYNKLN